MAKEKKKISKEELIKMIQEARNKAERVKQIDKSIDNELEHDKERFLFG